MSIDQHSDHVSQKEKLNLETSKIAWTELQRFFAGGYTLFVSTDLDLLEVAEAMADDRVEQLQRWVDAGLVSGVSDQQAKAWLVSEAIVWAVVIRPWVLVQEKGANKTAKPAAH